MKITPERASCEIDYFDVIELAGMCRADIRDDGDLKKIRAVLLWAAEVMRAEQVKLAFYRDNSVYIGQKMPGARELIIKPEPPEV